MGAVLELSRQEAPGLTSCQNTSGTSMPSYVVRQELNGRLSELDQELEDVDKQIEKLKSLRTKIVAERQDITNQLSARLGHQPTNLRASTSGSGSVRGPANPATIDYMKDSFEWTGELKARMRTVFGIQNFRLCQNGLVPLSSLAASMRLFCSQGVQCKYGWQRYSLRHANWFVACLYVNFE